MISAGKKKLDAILVVAERDKFTPCGSCLDWIFESVRDLSAFFHLSNNVFKIFTM